MASGVSEVNLCCTRSSVFKAACNGKLYRLKILLDHKPVKEVKTFVLARTNGTTPLLAACQKGHRNVVTYLIKKCHANVEQVGCVEIDGVIIEDVAPVVCAAAFNQINIVKALMKHNANVNAKVQNPLRAACFYGHFEIVKYLVEHGADIEIPNDDGRTSLMIACYKENYKIAKFLIDSGADLNRKSNEGNTALHDCAKSESLEILKLLLNKGAKIDKNKNNISPLIAAADYGNVSVVKYLLTEISCTKREQINALELLGASFVDKKKNLLAAVKFWKRALAMRSEDKKKCIVCSHEKSRLASYLDVKEMSLTEEAEDLVADPERMISLALLIRERIFGTSYFGTIFYIHERAYLYIENERNYKRCIKLWKYALHLMQKHKQPLTMETQCMLTDFTDLFLHMYFEVGERSVTIDEILFVFRKTVFVINLSKTQDKELLSLDFQKVVIVAMRLIALMSRLLPALNRNEELAVKKEIYPFIQLNPRVDRNYTPLHVACTTPFHLAGCRFQAVGRKIYQSTEVVKLLLEVGASPNDIDDEGNSPLHLAAKRNPFSNSMFRTLLNHGAHLDATNSKNEIPLALVHPSDIPDINPLQYVNLQCLCAKTINFFRIPYVGFVHRELVEFLSLHKYT